MAPDETASVLTGVVHDGKINKPPRPDVFSAFRMEIHFLGRLPCLEMKKKRRENGETGWKAALTASCPPSRGAARARLPAGEEVGAARRRYYHPDQHHIKQRVLKSK